jgi:hypothetical protein
MITRHTLRVVGPCLGVVVMLTACSSSTPLAAQQIASPRSACSLLTAGEARAAVGGTVQTASQCASLPSNQSTALYVFSGQGGRLLRVDVAWGKRQVTTFTVAHSGHARNLTQGGGYVPPPQYANVTVSGVPAYWRVSPSPITGNPSARSISALAKGYVVILTSEGLTQSQDESALASIINHL